MFGIFDYYLEAIFSKLKILLLRLLGADIGKNVKISRYVQLQRLPSKIRIDSNTAIDRNVCIIFTETPKNLTYKHFVTIGEHVYINRFTVLDSTISITIGANSMIGPHCYITDHDHTFQGYSEDTAIGLLPLDGEAVTIEENVWIGSHVVILKGVTIGKNSIIGAGSIVTKSVPSNSVGVGNPCKVIKSRNGF